jgi:acetyl/propionyl-CoA carboxylase alpha subunit
MSFVQVEHEGRRLRLAVVRTARGVWVGWPGGSRFFGPERAESAAGPGAPAEVRAPMTGRVIKVAVVQGQAVKTDDLLLILQAMKMEYRLTAPRDGVVERVFCAGGEMVDLGVTLVALAPAPAAAGAPRAAAAPGGEGDGGAA